MQKSSKSHDYILMRRAIDECQGDLWKLGRKLGEIRDWLDNKIKEDEDAKKKESSKKTK